MCAHILKITLYLKGKLATCVAITSYMEVKRHNAVCTKLWCTVILTKSQ